MRTIRKKILTDEESRPVAVQIDYEDWLEIERHLHEKDEGSPSDPGDGFEKLLRATSGTWGHGDGLDYQNRLRGEWDGR